MFNLSKPCLGYGLRALSLIELSLAWKERSSQSQAAKHLRMAEYRTSEDSEIITADGYGQKFKIDHFIRWQCTDCNLLFGYRNTRLSG